LANLGDDSSNLDSALRNAWAAIGFARRCLEDSEPINEPDDDRVQQEADIEDALDLAATALRQAEDCRTQEDVSEAAAAVSRIAMILEM
jgi:hypothetical protein